MANKPYTTVQRLTIEALDCVIKPPKYDSQGHLQIFIEPRIPVAPVQRNADPLLCYIGIDLDLSKPKGMPFDLKLHTYSFTTKYINMAKA